jgi:hypothetical protein
MRRRDMCADEADFVLALVVMVYLDVDRHEDSDGYGYAGDEGALRVLGVIGDDRERIGEHGDRFVEGDAVLCQVRLCLRGSQVKRTA